MNTKPQSFVRNWQWNNAWFLNQERKVKNIGMRQALEKRGISIYRPEKVLSPIYSHNSTSKYIVPVETKLNPMRRNSNHPLWNETPAYTYNIRTWMPKDMEVEFSLALTNTLAVPNLPERIIKKKNSTSISLNTELRLENAIKSAFLGDAVQRKLPRNFKVPFIGWHSVESKMRPRNQYDWKAFSWGRNTALEYGIPIPRKLHNLTRGIYNEILKSDPRVPHCLVYGEESEVHRQFIKMPSGELIRFNLDIPLVVRSKNPLTPIAGEEEVKATKESSVFCVAPQSPFSTLHSTRIYRQGNIFPVTSLQHSHPFINTVFNFQYNPMGDPFTDDKCFISSSQRGRCLIYGFSTALGQARLIYGDQVEGELPKPICVNVISTNGVRWEMATFQLNTLDLGSDVKNLFFHHSDSLRLMDFCGYREARPSLEGVKLETFKHLHALVTDGIS